MGTGRGKAFYHGKYEIRLVIRQGCAYNRKRNKRCRESGSVFDMEGRKMMRYRPDYYEEFTCIADKCPITCCQEWKIAVDEETSRKWKTMTPPETLRRYRTHLSDYTMKREGERVIRLEEDHRCPFLADDKLCCLVSAYGDAVLSETCTVFPREVHAFAGHEEETLMPCCPAVVDLWNERKAITFPEISGETEGEQKELFLIRSKLLELLEDTSVSLAELLKEAFYILLELDKQDELTESLIEDYFSKESIAKLREAIRDVPVDALDTMDECNELLQDLAVNYRKEGLYRRYLDPVIEQAEKLSETYEEETMRDALQQFADTFAAYELLMRKFLQNEIYSDLLVPDGSMESMIVALQWIAMEYAVIRHAIFLSWNRSAIRYETVRDYLVVITRMTGYDEEDIYEYLENSFESLQWEWGYFALIVGA